MMAQAKVIGPCDEYRAQDEREPRCGQKDVVNVKLLTRPVFEEESQRHEQQRDARHGPHDGYEPWPGSLVFDRHLLALVLLDGVSP